MHIVGRRLATGLLLVVVAALLWLLLAVLWVQSARQWVPPMDGAAPRATQVGGS
jgi:hypothetical protein